MLYTYLDVTKIKGVHIGIAPVTTKVSLTNHVYHIYINENTTSTVNSILKVCSHAFGHYFGYQHNSLSTIMSPLFSAPGKIGSGKSTSQQNSV